MTTPNQAIEPLSKQVLALRAGPVCGVTPPIDEQARIHQRISELNMDIATHKALLETAEKLKAQYERMLIPF